MANQTYASRGAVSILELVTDHGVRTLRGLNGQLTKHVFSPDGKRVAAMSQGFRVAAWDLATGRLLQTWQGAQGYVSADNAAVCFNPDGSRLALQSGDSVYCWDIASGEEIAHWRLNPGYVDGLAFVDQSTLISARLECRDGITLPTSKSPYADFPRVVRCRTLRPGMPSEEVEIGDFDMHASTCLVHPAGPWIAVAGRQSHAEGERWLLRIYDPQAHRLGTVPIGSNHEAQSRLAAHVPLLSVPTGISADLRIHRLPDGLEVARHPNTITFTDVSGPRAAWSEAQRCFAIYDAGASEPWIRFPFEGPSVPCNGLFSPDTEHFAWRQNDGMMHVADLKEVRRQLIELGVVDQP
jgi:hypothetical protein